ncbi:MAG TPA: hypothetical protein PKG54_05765 [Phycisphaerae bacterium]|jgi:hypothetical protein|nr:hypothetical protein [Phycisphaerae bacterium]HOB74016.1 hypothetical protein [Phycisphaerae bacterium]HOJ53853.1 hypothetical protein [Phycisphaerae bacterium]HOL26184.1 hypothetical protein [Phycisphaerae bacterium]HPP20171.1 hypothetical protein [Phycisphaerae bacterium]
METTATPVPATPLGLFEKARVVLAAAVAVILLSTVGWVVAEPADPGMGVTLVAHWGRVAAVWPALIVLTAVAGVIGTVLAPRRLAEGGMFVAAIGLAGMALKGGSMQEVLGYMLAAPETGARRSLMAQMALDSLLWTVVLAATWIAVALVRRWLWADEELYNPVPSPASRNLTPAAPAGKSQAGWPAMVVTGLIAVFFIWLTVGRTPVATIARGQVIASVAAGFYLGAMAARYFTRNDQAHWYLLAVPAGALLGFLVAFLNSGMGWAPPPFADLKTTPPHELARPLPIEYLAVGVAGTLAGFWSGERMEQATEQEKKT